MADTPKHSVSVAGVVVNEAGQVLVIQRRDNGQWEPPGGVLELDEGFEEGVVREVLEETGVRVTVNNLSGVYKNMQLGIVSLVFRCSPRNGFASHTDEAVKVAWMTVGEIEKHLIPAYAIRVSDALGKNPARARLHDGFNLSR